MESKGEDFSKTDRNRLRRLRERGSYNKGDVFGFLAERSSVVAHVGVVRVVDGAVWPVVLPMLFAADAASETLYLHGSNSMGLTKQSLESVCVTVTHLRELVVAKSLFNSSCNYTSVVLHGQGTLLETREEKTRALRLISAHTLHEKRWDDARPMTDAELDQTAVIAVEVFSASLKKRDGPPHDDKEDEQLPIWSGLIPFASGLMEPITDELSASNGLSVPPYFAK